MNHYRWRLLPRVPENHPLFRSGFSPLVVQLLYNRHLNEPSKVDSFLHGDRSLSSSPYLLPDIEKAVNRIYRALLSGENITIYGDYDADGITATALLVEGLKMLGGKVTPYIPHRMTEGYGLKITALEKLREQGVSLVITVDCGITAFREVKRARRMGMDVIITDHHTPLDELPQALAIVNPKLPKSNYPFLQLTGAGVAFKLLEALFYGMGRGDELEQLLDLVALGTVADMAPLLEDNRYLVIRGLEKLNTSPRLGLKELMSKAGLALGSIDTDRISWILAPRLNAAGRLAHALTSYKLLITQSPKEAEELASWLEEKNLERQNITSKAVLSAKEQVLKEGISSLLVAEDRDYPVGIAGLIASKLVEEFYRPTIVIKLGEQLSSGSCRSIPEFNIIAALSKCRHLLSYFGGHSQAAGFSLPTRNLPRFKQALLELARTELEGVDLRPQLDIDASISLPELGGDTFKMTQKLSPFGQGNPIPTFLSCGVEVVDCRSMGSGNEHLRLKLRQGGTTWDGVAFGWGANISEVASHLDIVYNLEVDHWNGGERLRLNILDFKPC